MPAATEEVTGEMVRFWRVLDLTVTVTGTGAETVLPLYVYVALMVVEPAATPVTRSVPSPLAATVAFVVSLDVQTLRVVTSWVVPSLKVAVTVTGLLVPAVRSRLVVESAMDESDDGEITVRVVLKGISVPDVAVIRVVGVTARGFSHIKLPPAAVTDARDESATVH